MSEIPAPLRDAIKNHIPPDQPGIPRTLGYFSGEGLVAGVTRDGWWALPEVEPGPDPIVVTEHETPAGLQNRTRTTVQLVDRAPQDAEMVRRSDIVAAWEAGELRVDPASLAAIAPDGLSGIEPAAPIRNLPLRTPTLPPATHTNCYLAGRQGAVIVDPGSPWPAELEVLATAVDRWTRRHGPPAAIFLTHHHGDHIGGANALRDQTGLPVWAHAETAARVSFTVDRLIDDGEEVAGFHAVFTPGHAPGHLCLHHRPTGLVIAGDMVASIGSIIVEPQDGDMRAYLDSLDRLLALEPKGLFPAHGAFIEDATGRLTGYRQHRLWREARIVEALTPDPSPLSDVTRRAYREVSAAILWLAEQSAHAHLLKLQADNRAAVTADGWHAV